MKGKLSEVKKERDDKVKERKRQGEEKRYSLYMMKKGQMKGKQSDVRKGRDDKVKERKRQGEEERFIL